MFAFCFSSFDVADKNSVIVLFKHLHACSKELLTRNEQGKSRPVHSRVYCFAYPGHIFNLMHTRYCYYTYSNTEELIKKLKKLKKNSGLLHSIVATLFGPIDVANFFFDLKCGQYCLQVYNTSKQAINR